MKTLLYTFILLFSVQSMYAQCLQGDCENGFGLWEEDGTKFYSFFENGKPTHMALHQLAGMYITYQIKEGQRSGIEIKYHPNGLFVINELENGMKNGYSLTGNFRKLTADLFKYENDEKLPYNFHSDFKAKKKSVRGGARCTGNCKDGLGIRVMEETYYLGVFEKRKASPIGVDMWFDSEYRYLGGSHDFKRAPFGLFRYENGTIWIGEIKKGKGNGYGITIYTDGTIKAALWKRDKVKESLFEGKMML